MRVILSALTARLLAVPDQVQTALPVPKLGLLPPCLSAVEQLRVTMSDGVDCHVGGCIDLNRRRGQHQAADIVGSTGWPPL